MREQDTEMAVIKKVLRALECLPIRGQARVLSYVHDRVHGAALGPPTLPDCGPGPVERMA